MTGEMFKPPNAEVKDEEYWSQSPYLDDEAFLIYPNYPQYFDMADKLTELMPNTLIRVQPFDVYQGPYVEIFGFGRLWQTDENWFLEVDPHAGKQPGNQFWFTAEELKDILR